MPTICSFVLPAIAVRAIGAHLPTFPQKIAADTEDYWDVSALADGTYTIRCSRDAATAIAKLLQAAGRSPVAGIEKTMVCIESAGLILTQLRRESL
jgi:hypothetical protein